MERIVFNELHEFCDHNIICPCNNSGFKQNYGTIKRLPCFTHNTYQGRVGCTCSINIFDILVTKAFDQIIHDGLLVSIL